MKISRIYIKNDHQRGYVKEVHFQQGVGILENKRPKSTHRQVAIFTEEGRRTVENLQIHGLCTKRFHENITIEDLDLKDLKIGNTLSIGKSLLEITEVGKRCFPDCNLLKDKNPCPLTKGVAYGKVLTDGKIHVDDEVLFHFL